MFKIEQIPIKPFQTLSPGSACKELLTLLRSGEDVAVSADGLSYVFTPGDHCFLSNSTGDGTLGEFLTDKAHLASYILPVHHDIRELHAALNGIPEEACRPVILSDRTGQLLGSCQLGSLLKITLAELLRLDAYFATLAETVTDAVTVVDRSGTVICWNENAEEIYGIPKEQILGRRIGEHFDPDALMVLKILDEGRLLRSTYHRPRPDTHVLINASPIYDLDNKIIGSIATEQDITHLVRLNDELTSSQNAPAEGAINNDDPFSAIKGKGATIDKAIRLAKKVASAETSCLLIGEAGTGKDLFAQAIHSASPRAEHPFVIVNCGSIPAGLLEIELFGYQGGTFSGQETGKAGQLELAGNGTIFLNEIDKLPADIQAKLYQTMQSQTIVRSGSDVPTRIHSRILAGTDQHLADMVSSRSFRGDLYYALNVVSISIPPLRERKEDIPSLAHLYVREFAVQYAKPIPAFDPEVMLAFMSYKWPGNLRELRNVIERCIILCDDERITIDLLPESLMKEQPQLELALEADAASYSRKALKPQLSEEDEISLIEDALSKTFGNKSAAAKLLGISRGTLYNKMKEFHIH
ncbi:PAS domain S-box-containing protein [Paenibacillus phyllosphaerae]|uniref:PAS domain S-box-containing protein n=1 Tax=Paenibacillus phyllosphaerae TaxID=274593 RepID=A0A7W5B5E9_9BACL|nr:sigma 54-interacting transcriptional regulator [Paenibacillus phyllosphaerae]MBB3114753.1 PAS domain S-box-containing protein [Paenibacillus phyllosphaerae]